ncbi:hypothetical protein [Desulfovibrio ferrophilus]|uniref:Inositol-5-monophosphate dehydrogenase n=1 Tax=Desulfovibrio ferrophilus TaxID=241368 RepID=A0A2Z6AYR8_9BACT|nr:hypothetical protein [Desulfovibrio ferrophilus]BBD08411.1 inositol-5-monophosphate dehydrogenase [Desulfovibrio ferrophilus]
MTPIMHITTVSLLWAALSLCSSTLLIGPDSAFAASSVPIQFQLPSNPGGKVNISSKDRAAIASTLSGYSDLIANVAVVMRGFDVNPYMTEGHTTRMAAFSLSLTLKNGSCLCSKMRKVPEDNLGRSIQECIRHCVRRYQKKTGGEEATVNLTNL